MSKDKFFFSQFLMSMVLACSLLLISNSSVKAQQVENPLFDGFYAADPTIVQYNGKFYIYATIDPWGSDELVVFVTKDFSHWERKHINWPTKEACTSTTSSDAMVWAPSVVKKGDKFYMYVSVGGEVWAGVAKNPLGPWRNMKADDSPLIQGDFIPGYHMIDAECFIDDDGQPYLYWGSGLNWVNGKCFVVKLKPDMYHFKDSVREVTPPNFFEAPYMLKHQGKYYLMYSNGKAIDSSYNIRYAIGESPYGPWKEGKNSPILSTTKDRTVIGPGHHALFKYKGQTYILFHKIFPQKKDIVLRQLCIGKIEFDKSGNIKKVKYQKTLNL